ncbi:putative alcohol dehydrogenase [Helianthus anomalus]
MCFFRVRCSFERCKTDKRFFCGRFRFESCGLTVAEGARIACVSRTIIVDLHANRLQEFVDPKDYKKPVQEMIAKRPNGGVDRIGRGVVVLWGFHIKNVVFKTSPLNLLNERTLKVLTFFVTTFSYAP